MPHVAFEVHALDHAGKVRTVSRHFTARGALKVAERYDRRVPFDRDDVRVWCACDNRHWPVSGFRAAYDRGDYA